MVGTDVRYQSFLGVRLAAGQVSRASKRHCVVRLLLRVLGSSLGTTPPEAWRSVYDEDGGLLQLRRRVLSRRCFADRESPSLGPQHFSDSHSRSAIRAESPCKFAEEGSGSTSHFVIDLYEALPAERRPQKWPATAGWSVLWIRCGIVEVGSEEMNKS